jgi:[acyl-carrier-protein] S-malonyltransferase
MNRNIAFLFPGQGAQYPGMGRDFYEQFSVARHVFEEADDVLGECLSKCIFEGPASTLTLTKNSQVAIYVTSLALLRVLETEYPELKPSVCAGLSLGEYTALTASGRLSFQEGLKLVQARALFMQQACERHPGSMQVVLGLEEQQVASALSGLKDIWVANLNCPGQIVIAGTALALEQAAPLLKSQGARRVLPLEVSGAFHSGLMQEAREKLEPLIRSVVLHEGSARLAMNTVGDFVENSEEIRTQLVRQVTSPVYWQKGVEAIHASGVTLYMEIGPGTTLTGMLRRQLIDESVSLNVGRVEDLEKVGSCAVF